jgi:Family of unknown function (DUF5335)
MPNPATLPSTEATDTITVDQGRWNQFLADFTRENRGAHARLDVLGPDVGYQVETENRPFDGIASDTKDGEHAVWIVFGSSPDQHLTHGVHGATTIRVRPPSGLLGAAVLIEARDGTKTLLELTRPEDYELPPAKAPEKRDMSSR